MDKIYYKTKGIYRQVNENYGIVTDKDEKEYFIFKRDRNNTFPGDQVEIGIKKIEIDGKKPEAIILNIITRTNESIIGIFIKKSTQEFGFVRAYNTFGGKDIFIYKEDFNKAENGDVVTVKIIKGKDKPVGKIINVIGKNSDKDIQEKVILLQNNIRLDFPEKVNEELNKLKEVSNYLERIDLRDEIIVTIDGEDAKDLDDAISVNILDNGNYKLGVHIADVAEYVINGSELDNEAKKRGTSIYIPGNVIPMLPKKISDDLCSLNTSGNKATLSIFMEIDKNTGKVIKKSIHETIIKSKARLTYNEVWDFLNYNKKSKQIENSKDLQDLLNKANKLYKIIYSRRKKEGKIEFEFPEIKIELDDKNKPIKIYKQIRNDAHKIIEEFMIISNEEISKFFGEKKIPFLYRIHERPSPESLEELKKIFFECGIKIETENINPLQVNNILISLMGKKEEYLLSKKILLTMSKAKYSDKIMGHFGLGLKYYSHFTSPIRRYPDLQIHRIIKEYIKNKLTSKDIENYKKNLGNIAKLSSTNEQKAEEIERKISFLKCIEYMEKHIGEIFYAKISGMTNNGIYAELESGIEGFIGAKTISSEYVYNEDRKNYINKKNSKELILGCEIKIKVIKADKQKGFLDFELKNT